MVSNAMQRGLGGRRWRMLVSIRFRWKQEKNNEGFQDQKHQNHLSLVPEIAQFQALRNSEMGAP